MTPPDRPWFVYMLRCRDGTLYTGVTTDLERRCAMHDAGTASRYTRARRPTTLVYWETVVGHGNALRREAVIKALSRWEKEALIRTAVLNPSSPATPRTA
jgi:predicted GIY-YIG superfamily endonuclease